MYDFWLPVAITSLHCTYGAGKQCMKHSEQSGRGVKLPPPPHSTEVKEHSGPSCQVVGWTLPLPWFWTVSGRSGMCHQHLHSCHSKMWCTGIENTAACLDYTGLGSTWYSSKAGDTADGRNTICVKWVLCLPYIPSGWHNEVFDGWTWCMHGRQGKCTKMFMG